MGILELEAHFVKDQVPDPDLDLDPDPDPDLNQDLDLDQDLDPDLDLDQDPDQVQDLDQRLYLDFIFRVHSFRSMLSECRKTFQANVARLCTPAC